MLFHVIAFDGLHRFRGKLAGMNQCNLRIAGIFVRFQGHRFGSPEQLNRRTAHTNWAISPKPVGRRCAQVEHFRKLDIPVLLRAVERRCRLRHQLHAFGVQHNQLDNLTQSRAVQHAKRVAV